MLFLLWTNVVHADKYALLIGINDYSVSGLNSLKGPTNDVKLTRDVLEKRFNFPKANIRVLIDKAATHQGLKQAFGDLAQKIEAEDMVYIHYSGHGSFTPDLNQDEPGKFDRTWVTWGSRHHKNSSDINNYDVLDDELDEWLIPVIQTARQVVLVSDYCHSASVTRSADAPRVRAAPIDMRVYPFGKRRYKRLDDDRGIRIGSAGGTQSAVEHFNEDRSTFGLFTWYWMSVLQDAKPGQTWNDLFRKVETKVRSVQGYSQEPWITGQYSKQVFGGEFVEPSRLLPVSRSEGQSVYIDAGLSVGVTKGSVYRLHAAKGRENVRVTIENVKPFKSIGLVRGGMVEAGDSLEEIEHGWSGILTRAQVVADLEMDTPLVSDLQNTVSEAPGYELVDNRTNADMVLRVLRPGKTVFLVNSDGLRELPPSRKDAEPELWVLNSTDDLYHPELRYPLRNKEETIKILRKDLDNLSYAHEFRRLSDQDRKPPLQLQLIHLQRRDCNLSNTKCREIGEYRYLQQAPRPAEKFEKGKLAYGDIVSFVINNPTRKKYWVYLVNIAPDTGVDTIFPGQADNAETALIEPGTRDLRQTHGLLLDKTGEEILVMIASRKPIRTDLLAGLGIQGSTVSTVKPGSITGLKLKPDDKNDRWGVESYSFQVVSKPGEEISDKNNRMYGAKGRSIVSEIIEESLADSIIRGLMDKGNQAYELSDFSTALSKWRQALKLARDYDDPRSITVGKILGDIGLAYWNLGDYEDSLIHYEDSLEINRELENKIGMADNLINIGATYIRLGDYEKALKVHQEALRIYEELGNSGSQGAVISNIGIIYFYLGEYSMALDSQQRALEIHRKIGAAHSAIKDISSIGVIHSELERYHEAIEYYQEALDIGKNIEDHSDTGLQLNNIGWAYTKLGKNEKALTYYRQALSICGESGDKYLEGIVLNNIGETRRNLDDFEKSLSFYVKAQTIAVQIDAQELLWEIYDGMRKTLESLKEPLAAVYFGKKSVNTLQGMRSNISGLENSFQHSFLKNKKKVYKGLALLLIDLGRFPEAQQVMNMLKEEEYFDYMRGDASEEKGITTIHTTEKEEEWLDRYLAIEKKIISTGEKYHKLLERLQSESLSEEDEEGIHEKMDRLADDLKIARKGFLRTIRELRIAFKEDKNKGEYTIDNLAKAEGLREFLGESEDNVVLIHTLMTASDLILMVTTSQTQVVRRSEITPEELNRLIFSFREDLKNPKQYSFDKSQALYKYIFLPIIEDLKQANVKTLVWSLDSTLRYLPIQALHDGKSYVAENYSTVIITPASHARFRARPKANWRISAFGVSKKVGSFTALPAVPVELEEIVRTGKKDANGVLPGNIYLDDSFTADRLRKVLRRRYPVLHIASHFSLSPGRKEESFLILGDRNKPHLTLDEIKTGYKFDGIDLLTLSACDTALGNKADGSEVEGFAAMAQDQGAKAVLATLWPIADRSTADFMKNFYGIRQKKGITKAEALRRSRLMFIYGNDNGIAKNDNNNRGITLASGMEKDKSEGLSFAGDPKAPFSHPFYWAPFILLGNWL